MQITKHSVVTIHYTLRDPAGAVLDSSDGGDPLVYMHGVGGLIPGMESAMEGRSAGDDFTVEIAPEEGYGQRDEAMVQAVPRNLFQGVDKIEAGMRFAAQTAEGPRPVVVVAVSDEEVTIDANHPLAGVTLHFTVQVLEVRQATEEEMEHGHAHGAHHHHGDECGCGDDCDCDDDCECDEDDCGHGSCGCGH
jgi:FKBP-type peptidyl-prolyl cis-trans isomerase SlyD